MVRKTKNQSERCEYPAFIRKGTREVLNAIREDLQMESIDAALWKIITAYYEHIGDEDILELLEKIDLSVSKEQDLIASKEQASQPTRKRVVLNPNQPRATSTAN